MLPETALPRSSTSSPAAYLRDSASAPHAAGKDVLLGLVERTPARRSAARYYNSVVRITGRRRAVVPQAPPRALRRVHPAEASAGSSRILHIPLADFSARRAPASTRSRSRAQRVAVDICYEDVFGAELIAALPAATCS